MGDRQAANANFLGEGSPSAELLPQAPPQPVFQTPKRKVESSRHSTLSILSTAKPGPSSAPRPGPSRQPQPRVSVLPPAAASAPNTVNRTTANTFTTAKLARNMAEQPILSIEPRRRGGKRTACDTCRKSRVSGSMKF